MSDKPRDYPVGYGKPPVNTRFKPGVSGNPRGRPKGVANLKTDLAKELAEPIRVREGDRERSITKQRAMIKTLIAKTLKGDTRAATLVMALIAKHFEKELAAEISDRGLSQSDSEILNAFLARNVSQPNQEKKDE